MTHIRSSVLILSLIFAPAYTTADESFDSSLQPLLKTFCLGCHSGDSPKGERSFDALNGDIPDDNTLTDYQDILDQLNLTEMPPDSSKQPSVAQRRHAITWLTNRIRKYHQSRANSAASSRLRRLNAREYRNTVRDLFALDMTLFDPTSRFPRDQTIHHLDNQGETLVTSGHLLDGYLEAAEQVVDRVLFPLQQPEIQTWTFQDNFRQQPEIDQVHRTTNQFKHMTLYDVPGADKPEGAYGPILAFRRGVPQHGTYEIRFEAEALHREHPYEDRWLGRDSSEKLRLEIVAGQDDVGDLHTKQPVEPVLAAFQLKDGRHWYSARVRLDKHFTPRFTFPNGQMDMRNLYAKILRRYPDQFPKPTRRGIVGNRMTVLKFGKLPQIRIHHITIRGPLFEEWPTKSCKRGFGQLLSTATTGQDMSVADVREQLVQFLPRAFRRPVDQASVDRFVRIFEIRRAAGHSAAQAWRDCLIAVLCSPGFLFLEQPLRDEQQLSPHAIAARLSYFLWSSLPDDELTRLADSGEILSQKILGNQVDRLLNDPRSDAFVNGFLNAWLGLRDLGQTPPERSAFRDFYQYNLDRAMRRETFLFTRHLLDENLGLRNFLHSDFAFVNRALSRHYELPADLHGMLPPSNTFEKVALSDGRRGGLLGQASLLTLTANGVDTSPVLRGVWVLENILGNPPAPPPPDVKPLDPDVRGAKSIRAQLKKHRATPSCHDCHRRIDPPGFALENFDPIGGWRERYENRTPIDASGNFAGQSFDDVRSFKQLLLKHERQFTHALATKMLAYACGRRAGVVDRPALKAICDETFAAGNGFRDIVHAVVASPEFRK